MLSKNQTENFNPLPKLQEGRFIKRLFGEQPHVQEVLFHEARKKSFRSLHRRESMTKVTKLKKYICATNGTFLNFLRHIWSKLLLSHIWPIQKQTNLSDF